MKSINSQRKKGVKLLSAKHLGTRSKAEEENISESIMSVNADNHADDFPQFCFIDKVLEDIEEDNPYHESLGEEQKEIEDYCLNEGYIGGI